MIGTHNSLSYLPVSQWWLKPFLWVAKCQSKSLLGQYKAGARWFDIRLKIGKNGYYVLGHGLITYDVRIPRVLFTLSECCEYHGCVIYVRLMLEDNSNRSRFANAVELYKKTYPSLCFVDARIKSDYSIVVPGVSTNESHEYQLFQDYSATNLWQKIIGLKFPFPLYWARKNNKKLSSNYRTDNTFHIIDFL